MFSQCRKGCFGCSPSATAGCLGCQQLQRAIQIDFEHRIGGTEIGIQAVVDNEGPKSSDTGLHGFTVFWVFAEQTGQAEQRQRDLHGQVIRLHSFEQAGTFGFAFAGRVIFAQLDIRSVRAYLEQNWQFAFGVVADKLRPFYLAREEGGCQLVGQVSGGQGGRQVGSLPFAVFFAHQIGAILADAHLRLQIAQGHCAGYPRVDGGLTVFDLVFQSSLAQVELAQIGEIVGVPGGDIVEPLFHMGGKFQVDQFFEVVFQQFGDRKGRKSRDQLFALLEDITALLNGVDDRGIGAWPADPFGFEGFDQSGFGVAGGWLGGVAGCIQRTAVDWLAGCKFGQQLFLAVECGVWVVGALYIGTEKAREENRAPAGTKGGIFDLNRGSAQLEPGVGHLRGDGAFPDQVVERAFTAIERQAIHRNHLVACWTDRLVRLLRVGCFGLVTAGGWRQKLCAIHFLDSTAGSLDRFFAQVD